MQPIKFTGSRRLVWFSIGGVFALNVYALNLTGQDAIGLVTSSCLGVLGLVGGWSVVVNKAEVDHAKITQGG